MRARELQQRLRLRAAQHWLTGPLRRRPVPVLSGNGRGLRVQVGESVMRVTSRGEERVERALLGLLSPGDVFYDVGANIGWYGLLAARAVGPSGSVVAFEPELENAFCAQRNAEANGFTQMSVIAAAVAGEDSWLAFDVRGSLQGRLRKSDDEAQASLRGGHDAHLKATRLVPAVTLDSWLAATSQRQPTVIKIDVEGAELGVLHGMRETLAATKPALIIELHGTREGVADVLDAAGYEHLAIESGGPSREAHYNGHVLANSARTAARA